VLLFKLYKNNGMQIKIGINGLGRIGKLILRHSIKYPHIKTLAVNDLMDINTMSHLLRYDTVHGHIDYKVGLQDDNKIVFNDNLVHVYNAKLPEEIPWENHDIDYIIESSGKFLTYEKLSKHLRKGIKKIILSCPAQGTVDKNIVMGVNHQLLMQTDRIISNTSCTTNCLAPILHILDKEFCVENAFINTIHPYTNNQALLDAPHADLRRARAAALNIIPTTSTAVNAVMDVLPQFRGKLDGLATRVPVVDGALIELTVLLSKGVDRNTINKCFKESADNEMKGIIQYSEEPLVSTDIINNSHSAVFDALSTRVLGNHFIQIIVWYDNEYAYSRRILDLIEYASKIDA